MLWEVKQLLLDMVEEQLRIWGSLTAPSPNYQPDDHYHPQIKDLSDEVPEGHCVCENQ